ncbi:hypothetical protein ACSUZJ_03590 [Telluria sp. B2]
MKSVMFSEVVRSNQGGGWLRSLPPLAAYGLTVAIGMPLLVLALHLFDPTAPLALIVLPVLAGLALPLCASTPGRLDVNTRFDASHMSMTLDSTLSSLGYARCEAGPGLLRYVRTARPSWRARTQTVNVRVHAHALEVVGPIPVLRSLQKALAS